MGARNGWGICKPRGAPSILNTGVHRPLVRNTSRLTHESVEAVYFESPERGKLTGFSVYSRAEPLKFVDTVAGFYWREGAASRLRSVLGKTYIGNGSVKAQRTCQSLMEQLGYYT